MAYHEEPKFNRQTLIRQGTIFGILILIGAIIPGILRLITPHYMGELYGEPIPLEPIALPRADGGTFESSEYLGKVMIYYFGYTSCPDVCPTTLYDLRRMEEDLGEQAKEVEVIFITVDPDNDTAEKMAQYLAAFDPSFIPIAASPDQLKPVYEQFNVGILGEEETVAGSGVSHTTSAFVVDRQGRLRLRMHHGTRPSDMANDIRIFLREKSS